MCTGRFCAIYLILLYENSEFHYHFKRNLVFKVTAVSTTDRHIDWITTNYRRQGTNVPAGTVTPTLVSELRPSGKKYGISTSWINFDTVGVTKSTEIPSRVSPTQTKNPYGTPAYKNVKYFGDELLGCKKKWAHTCATKKKQGNGTITSSEKATAVTLNGNTSLQGEVDKDLPLSTAASTETQLQSSDIYRELNTCCDSDTTTTTRNQDSVVGRSIPVRLLLTGAGNITDAIISQSETKEPFNTNISSVASIISTPTPEIKSNVANAQRATQSPETLKLKKASLAKKKAKKCLPNTSQLRMTLKLENSTVFYPGNSEDSPFHTGNHINLDDAAYKEMHTYFLLKLDESNGVAYADSLDDSDKYQSIQCFVNGLTNDVVYTGWHRWTYPTSAGTLELICEANTIPSSFDTGSVTDISTKYPLWHSSEQGDPSFDYMLVLQPSVTGLYICIAVDANYNVFLSSYLDIRIMTVVTSVNASISPQTVQIYKNDTIASFIFNHCKGSVYSQAYGNVCSAPTVHFFYLDNSNVGNASFTVSYLHTQPWDRAERVFEKLDLYSPMILRCQFTLSSISNIDKTNLELYFRHETAKNNTQKAFTAVTNETLDFSCKQWFSSGTQPANASYFEGECSESKPSYTNGEDSHITLTVNKQMCLVCSSQTSQIKLQINTEEDLRTKVQVTNRTNDKNQGNCSVIWDVATQLATVNGSSNCEANAVTLNQNKTITFKPFTYKAYYTSRQLIVCQSQPVTWSAIDTHKSQLKPSKDTFVFKVIAAVVSIIITLLMFLVWIKLCKRKQQPQDVQLDSIDTHNVLAQARPSFEKAVTFDELDFGNPGEYIDHSRISIAALLGSGKFGKVYKAYVKCKSFSNSDGVLLEVAVKELKSHLDKNTHNGTMNKEIQIMRMIVPHLNIIKYYGYSLSSDSNLLIMEIAKGSNLLEYLREQRMRVPGFVLRMNFRGDCPADVKHALVSFKISNSSYSNVAYSHDSFELGSNSLSQMDDSTYRSIHTLYSDNEVLETAEYQQRDPNNCIDCMSVSSVPGQDQWDLEYEASHAERSTAEHSEPRISDWSRRSSSIIEDMSKEIFSICRQVARAMAHISALNIIHRDLAARNIVVSSYAHPLVVKICDFGMAHHLSQGEIIFKEDSVGPRPFRWMSPEALNKGEFSVFSDVWSYGVVCWEVITLGSYPFDKMPNFAAAAKVAAGHYLPRPSNCESEIYAILKSCWRMKPDERPSFERLEEKWSDILEANSDYLELETEEFSM